MIRMGDRPRGPAGSGSRHDATAAGADGGLSQGARRLHRLRRGASWRQHAGRTLAETRANLREAIQLVLEANRALAERDLAGQEVIREPIRVPAE